MSARSSKVAKPLSIQSKVAPGFGGIVGTNMKIIALVAIAAVGFAAPALAAEPSFVVPALAPDGVPATAPPFTKAPPIAATGFSWTGCYIGTRIGGVISEDKNIHKLFGGSTSYSSAGFMWGGQIGCD